MRKIILMLWLACLSITWAKAQKTCVIASAEDHVPIREALIHTDNNHWARTDYRGYWTMKYQFDSATVSKKGFLRTRVYYKELPDTVFMIPESHQISTVEVWGKSQEHVKDMNQQFSQAAAEAGRNAALGKTKVVGFDLGNMLDGRGRRDRKHLRKAQENLTEYDKKDPIVAAYEQATGKKYRKLEAPDAVLSSGNKYSAYKKEKEVNEEGNGHEENEEHPQGQVPLDGSENIEQLQNSTLEKSKSKKKKTQVFVESSVGVSY